MDGYPWSKVTIARCKSGNHHTIEAKQNKQMIICPWAITTPKQTIKNIICFLDLIFHPASAAKTKRCSKVAWNRKWKNLWTFRDEHDDNCNLNWNTWNHPLRSQWFYNFERIFPPRFFSPESFLLEEYKKRLAPPEKRWTKGRPPISKKFGVKMLEVWWIYNVDFLSSSGIFDIFRPSWRVKVWPGNQPNLTKGAPPTDDGNQYHLLHSPAIGPQSFTWIPPVLPTRISELEPSKKEERLFDSVCFLFGFWDGSPGKPLVTWDHGWFFSHIFHLKRDWTPNGWRTKSHKSSSISGECSTQNLDVCVANFGGGVLFFCGFVSIHCQ